MRYRLKSAQVSIYIAVLTYVAMVFCPIQHITHSWRLPWKLASHCTPTWRLFSVFLCNLEGGESDDITWKTSILISTKGGLKGWGRGHIMISILLEDRQYWMLVRYLAVLKQSVAKQQRVPVPGLHLRPKAVTKRKNKMYLCRHSAASASRLLSGELTAEPWQYAKQHEKLLLICDCIHTNTQRTHLP